MDSAYLVLGLESGAGIDDVIKAYRRLMRMLDLSNYMGTPLADLARRRRQEAEQAFRQLVNHLNVPASSLPAEELILAETFDPSNETGSIAGNSWLFIGPGLNDPHQQSNFCSRTCENCGDCCECFSDCGDCGDCCSGCDC